MDLVLAIVGDRRFTDWNFFHKTVKDELERFPASQIVTGDCSGTDAMALDFALLYNIPYMVYCADKLTYTRMVQDGINAVLASDWREDGLAAGPIRNRFMLSRCDRVLLFDGGGKGSASVKKLAKELGKEVSLWEIVPWDGTKIALQEQSQIRGAL